MSDTTVQAKHDNAYHTSTTTIAEALRRVADVFEESPMDLPETWLSIKVQVTEHDDPTTSDADRIQAIEMLHGFFGDGMPNWTRTEGSTQNWGIYSGPEVHHLGASYTAYGRTPHPAWIVGRDELDAYEWQAELDRKSAAAQEAADREQAERAIAAYRALDPWHTPEDAVNAIRGALGIPTDEVTQELDCPPRYIESSADIIDGQGDRWIYLGDDRYTLSDAAGLDLSRRGIREKYGVPNETAAERAEYDRRAGEASNELGVQVVDEAMATYEHDPSIAEAVVDTIDGTPSLPVGAYVATPVLDATAGTITATAAPLPDSDEPKPWYRCSSESCGSTADQPCNLIADAVIAAHRTDAS